MVSQAEYLATVYRPDREYVNGQLSERNLGEYDHANLQTAIADFLRSRQKALGITTLVEQRVLVKEGSYRVPDICLLDRGHAIEQIVRIAPLLVIEILSPRDMVYHVQDRIDDYLQMGVPEVWVIDPQSLRTGIYFGHEAKEARDGELNWRGTKLRLAEWQEE